MSASVSANKKYGNGGGIKLNFRKGEHDDYFVNGEFIEGIYEPRKEDEIQRGIVRRKIAQHQEGKALQDQMYSELDQLALEVA